MVKVSWKEWSQFPKCVGQRGHIFQERAGFEKFGEVCDFSLLFVVSKLRTTMSWDSVSRCKNPPAWGKRLYDNYYGNEPTGAAFPIIEWSGLPFMKEILKKHDWHGEIDLTDPIDLFNFIEYVNG